MNDWISKAKQIVFEDDGAESKPPSTLKPRPALPTPAPMPVDSSQSPIYKSIRQNTEFSATPLAAQLHAFLDPLSAIPDSVMSQQVKFTTAFLQARAQLGITRDQVLAVFDAMVAELQGMESAFNDDAARFEKAEISDKSGRQSEIAVQIGRLEEEERALRQQVTAAAERLDANKKAFAAAKLQRTQELTAERQQWESLLKG